jgi:MFS family permease
VAGACGIADRRVPPDSGFTIVNLALPSIRQSLGATSAQVQFVISAYAATYAVMLITGGRLGDLLGRKRMFLLARCQLGGIEEGLACAGIGYGIVMPGIIKAVIGNIDERHAGLAAGMVMTALQIGSALGIAIVGGTFYAILGTRTDIHSYAHAFSDAMALNVVLLALGCVLSLCLPNETRVVRL